VQPQDLTFEKVAVVGEGDVREDGEQPRHQSERLLEPDVAKKIIEYRDRELPLGLRN
jgi:hypothetical protein